MTSTNPKNFLDESEKQRVVAAIREAERQTSGEIRVHIVERAEGDTLETAKTVFEKLGMTATRERNGVLFFLSLKDHRFAVLGDSGIHEKVQGDFWDSIRDEMAGRFQGGQFVDGIVAGIRKCGEKLAEHFPRRDDDIDELPNEI